MSSKSNYDIIQILKHSDNRYCCDCNTPTSPYSSNTYANLIFGVWICQNCSDIHKDIFTYDSELNTTISTSLSTASLNSYSSSISSKENLSKFRNVKDNWFEEDVKTMKFTGSNKKFNSIYEKYVPSNWTKPTESSPELHKRQWIRAKYISKLFTIPNYNNKIYDDKLDFLYFNKSLTSVTTSGTSNKNASRDARIENFNILPSRIADYFVVLSGNKLDFSVKKNNYLQNSSSKFTLNSPPSDTNCIRSIEDIIQFNIISEISDCLPDFNCYPDTPIPDLLGPMVFPNGMKLSLSESLPYNFTFVLTDINRVKLYCSVLIVYEPLNEETLFNILPDYSTIKPYLPSTVNSKDDYKSYIINNILQNKILYCPKALVIISHYSFFSLYNKFLYELYKVSLSETFYPIERYLINFLMELPLPPQGLIEINYTLPEFILNISRPSKNYLPMIDFSFLPLFLSLNLDNILLVFSAICLEMSVCFCSSNLSLLTPIQEAFLTFLYPFLWQGCYVPILPDGMIELLDAPVPLLVGIHSNYLSKVPPISRPKNVIFVDLDKNILHYGGGEFDMFSSISTRSSFTSVTSSTDKPSSSILNSSGQLEIRSLDQLYRLQRKNNSFIKLKKNLSELLESLFNHSSNLSTLKNQLKLSGYLFPSSDYLTPIREMIYDGSISTQNSSNFHQNFKENGKILGFKANKKDMYDEFRSGDNSNGYPYRHSGASTIMLSSIKKFPKNILDPENNLDQDVDFDANAIRIAFLRFFVASFIDYQDFFVNSTDSHANFNYEGYANSLNDDFLAQMVQGQMFSHFISENKPKIKKSKKSTKSTPSYFIPNDILYFNEHILAKKNRSKLKISKTSTPFLSSTSYFIRKSFQAPIPYTLGLKENVLYSYNTFPTKFNRLHFGTIRPPKLFIEVVTENEAKDKFNKKSEEIKEVEIEYDEEDEIKRRNMTQGLDYLKEQYKKLNKDTSSLDNKLTLTSNSLLSVSNSNAPSTPSPKSLLEKEKEFFLQKSLDIEEIIKKIIKIQSNYLRFKQYNKYNKMRLAINLIKRCYKRYKINKINKLLKYNKKIIKIQTCIRGYLIRRSFNNLKHYTIFVQKHIRKHLIQKKFQSTKLSIIKIQKYIRRYLIKIKIVKFLYYNIKNMLKILLILYYYNKSSLINQVIIYFYSRKFNFYTFNFLKNEILSNFELLNSKFFKLSSFSNKNLDQYEKLELIFNYFYTSNDVKKILALNQNENYFYNFYSYFPIYFDSKKIRKYFLDNISSSSSSGLNPESDSIGISNQYLLKLSKFLGINLPPELYCELTGELNENNCTNLPSSPIYSTISNKVEAPKINYSSASSVLSPFPVHGSKIKEILLETNKGLPILNKIYNTDVEYNEDLHFELPSLSSSAESSTSILSSSSSLPYGKYYSLSNNDKESLGKYLNNYEMNLLYNILKNNLDLKIFYYEIFNLNKKNKKKKLKVLNYFNNYLLNTSYFFFISLLLINLLNNLLTNHHIFLFDFFSLSSYCGKNWIDLWYQNFTITSSSSASSSSIISVLLMKYMKEKLKNQKLLLESSSTTNFSTYTSSSSKKFDLEKSRVPQKKVFNKSILLTRNSLIRTSSPLTYLYTVSNLGSSTSCFPSPDSSPSASTFQKQKPLKVTPPPKPAKSVKN